MVKVANHDKNHDSNSGNSCGKLVMVAIVVWCVSKRSLLVVYNFT